MVEFSIGVTVFFIALFAVLEFGRLLWTHNALSDAARRGARYAAITRNDGAGQTKVRNVMIYGVPDPPVGATPIVSGLVPGQIDLSYSGFGVKQGTITVRITNYQFTFLVPLIGATLTLPEYKTTLTGESAGYEPANL